MSSRDDGIDRGLVRDLVRQRDPQAFASLYTRHSTYLYRLALRLTGGEDDLAQDLVHDAWLRAVQRLPVFEWRSQLRTWLAGFVVSLWREQQRDTRRDAPFDDHVVDDGAPWPDHAERLDLERALTALPPGFREVLVLHDVEGFTHEEIAAMLGTQPGTSKSQLSRARHAMRRALREPDTTGNAE